MAILKIPFKDNYLPSGYVLGYDGENLTTELRIECEDIRADAVYTLELGHTDGIILEKHDNYLSAELGADVMVAGDVKVQLVWSWKEYKDGKAINKIDMSNSTYWRVLDSVKLSEMIEKQYPAIVQQMLNDINELKEYGGGGSSKPGFSPIVEMTETVEGVEISITDLNGEKTVLVKHGTDGDDGFSPEVTLEEDADGVNITTTHKNAEPTTVKVKHGVNGYTPQKGKDYFDGYTPEKGKDYFDGYTPQKNVDYFDGDDGFSPEVTAEETETGVKITVTHKDAEPTVVEMKNGKDGQDYVFTDADCQAVAAYVYAMFEDGDTLTY